MNMLLAAEINNQNLSSITNTAFLSALLGSHLNQNVQAWVCTFSQDPEKGVWSGKAWEGDDLALVASNNFFSIGLIKPDAKGRLARKKANFACLPCIMLDDIGTKAGELKVPPTWMIETSPGNYQAGYAFIEPISDIPTAEAFLKALTTAGRLTDGGGQNVCRYARLPVGSNTKPKYGNPSPRHRLSIWEPDRRYDWRELAHQFDLELDAHGTQRIGKKAASRPVEADATFVPRSADNPVINLLKQRGMYKTPLDPNKHDIQCPWVSEHTDQDGSGTVYFEPSDNFPRGGFKCHHGHCTERNINELLALLGITDHEAKHKPTFRITGGTLHIAVNNAERVMAETGRYFQQGGAIVSVMTPPEGETAAKHIRKEALPFLLTGHASWLRYDARSDDWVPIDAPTKVCAGLFDAPEYRHLPPLNAIARQPYLSPDGHVVTQSGFDHCTNTFGAFDSRLFNVIENPSKVEVESALKKILGLVMEAAFGSEADQATALAAFLTAAARPSLPVAPGFLFNAHQPGSGKSYLQDLTILFATDGNVASATLKANDDEMEKSLLATLLRSPAVVRFDEAQSDILPVKFLVSALTSEHVAGRILGQSKVITPSTRSLFLFAGNNIQPVGDMLRRVLVCNLDARVENPESREFKHDPLTHLRDHRAEYVSAALTLICAHHQANQRIPCRPLNGFRLWEEWIRQTVLWLGFPDPCTGMFAVAHTDPNLEKLCELLLIWEECFGKEPKAARDAVRRADATPRLRTILSEIAGKNGEIDATKLGYWLKRNEGKVIGGKRLERYKERTADVAKYVLANLKPNHETPITSPTPFELDAGAYGSYGSYGTSLSERGKVSEGSPADVEII